MSSYLVLVPTAQVLLRGHPGPQPALEIPLRSPWGLEGPPLLLHSATEFLGTPELAMPRGMYPAALLVPPSKAIASLPHSCLLQPHWCRRAVECWPRLDWYTQRDPRRNACTDYEPRRSHSRAR